MIGLATSRGTRSHQEDFHAFATLSLDPEELRLSVKKVHAIDWNPDNVGEPLSRQVVFVGIYDGYYFSNPAVFFSLRPLRHGGSAVSQYLRQELHGLIESVNKSMIPELFAWTQELGGYFKRFKGGALAPWVHGVENTPSLDLEARVTTAFFDVRFFCHSAFASDHYFR